MCVHRAVADVHSTDVSSWLQVQVDAPRTAPEVAFFAQPAMQQALQRVLYLWGIRWAGTCISG